MEILHCGGGDIGLCVDHSKVEDFSAGDKIHIVHRPPGPDHTASYKSTFVMWCIVLVHKILLLTVFPACLSHQTFVIRASDGA